MNDVPRSEQNISSQNPEIIADRTLYHTRPSQSQDQRTNDAQTQQLGIVLVSPEDNQQHTCVGATPGRDWKHLQNDFL